MNPTDQQPNFSNSSIDESENAIDSAVANPAVDNSAEVSRAKKWDKILNILLLAVLLVLIATLVTKAFFVTNVRIDGTSMMPTYQDRQKVLVKRNFTEKDIQRGDIITCYPFNRPSWFNEHFNFFPKSDEYNEMYKMYIKRVVATQGDKIWVEKVSSNNWQVIIKTPDGQILFENNYVHNEQTLSQEIFYIYGDKLGSLYGCTEQDPYIVPYGYIFIMGDNRNISSDSRSNDVGVVSYDNIFGIVME